MCIRDRYKILSLKDAENTEDVINVIDEIYNHVLDPSFEKRNGNLERILNLPDMALANDAWQECMTDEQMEDIIQKYLSNLKKDVYKRQALDKYFILRYDENCGSCFAEEQFVDIKCFYNI